MLSLMPNQQCQSTEGNSTERNNREQMEEVTYKPSWEAWEAFIWEAFMPPK